MVFRWKVTAPFYIITNIHCPSIDENDARLYFDFAGIIINHGFCSVHRRTVYPNSGSQSTCPFVQIYSCRTLDGLVFSMDPMELTRSLSYFLESPPLMQRVNNSSATEPIHNHQKTDSSQPFTYKFAEYWTNICCECLILQKKWPHHTPTHLRYQAVHSWWKCLQRGKWKHGERMTWLGIGLRKGKEEKGEKEKQHEKGIRKNVISQLHTWMENELSVD